VTRDTFSLHAGKGITQESQGNYEHYIVCFHKFVLKTQKISCAKQGQVVSAEEVS